MTTWKMDKDSPSLTPHGDPLKVPGKNSDTRPDDKGIDLPAEPGRPTPGPSHPDLPGGPPEPVEPGKKPTL